MQVHNGSLLLSPSDLAGHLLCEHLTQLNSLVTEGDIVAPTREDPALAVVTRRGLDHEHAYLAKLKDEGLSVVEIGAAAIGGALDEALATTTKAMQAGAQVIYQGALAHEAWFGIADFLMRRETASSLGAWSYDVVDTKLAQRVKADALLRLLVYADLLDQVQGVQPEFVHLVLGDGSEESFRVSAYSAYYRSVKASLEQAIQERPTTYPDPVDHCSLCRWSGECDARRRADDHLCLVAGLGRAQTVKLRKLGVSSVAQLSVAADETLHRALSVTTSNRLRQQARLQIEQRKSGSVSYELLSPEANRGLNALPEPSPGDLFFDIEGDPFVQDGGLEYLLGVLDADGEYTAIWSHTRAAEKAGFERLIAMFSERLKAFPDMHIYHYASYEPVALRRLASRHGTGEEELDRLLRADVFCDLYSVVRHSLRISQESYSIKKLEPLYMDEREASVVDAASSIVAYEQWLEEQDDATLDAVERYNAEDCESTRLLRGWLEERRVECTDLFGDLERPEVGDPEPPPKLLEALVRIAELERALSATVPEEEESATDEQRATLLLSNLLAWHRREDRPAWWDHYRRLELTDSELLTDPESIGEVMFDVEAGREKQSILYRYTFDPAQEHKFEVGDTAVDPSTGKAAGTVAELDSAKGVLVLKRGVRSTAPHPTSVIPAGPIDSTVLREAMIRVGLEAATSGVFAKPSVGNLLARVPPIADSPAGSPLVGHSDILADCRRVARTFSGVLPVQGPPGSGKTYIGARMVVELARQGRKVAVSGTTHKAISNLVSAIAGAADEEGLKLRLQQRADAEDAAQHPMVTVHASTSDLEAIAQSGEFDVIAGTPWLFAREGMESICDVLVIDEAGQMSLASAIAIVPTAANLILLGDSNQLANPSRGVHPPGAEVSLFEHVLGGVTTVEDDRGIFLPVSYRMHPEVCSFISETFYEGRLEPHASCVGQQIEGFACGLRFVPVDHGGNRAASFEEAEVVASLVSDAVGRRWTDQYGDSRDLTIEDVLIVAPYNAQVARLKALLPADARVGTVDRFQGQEAPLVIVSMATSTTEEIPRGMEFLYSPNRLNVAISRARALAVLVASPRLFKVRCATPRQMSLANAFCRYTERAF